MCIIRLSPTCCGFGIQWVGRVIFPSFNVQLSFIKWIHILLLEYYGSIISISRKAKGCEAKFGLRHLSQGAYFVCCSIFWLWTNLSYLYFMKNILKPSTRNHYGVIGHRFLHFWPFLAVVIALKMARYDFDQPHDWKPTTRLKAIHQCSKIWGYSFPTTCISEVMGNQFLQF